MSRRRAKVLLVDDSEFIREVVRAVLQDAGFDVIGVDSPTAFSRAVMLEKPDLILLDITMPALSGDKLVEVAQRLHRCPVVLFSDRHEAELARIVRASGATGYIRKSPDPALLVIQVRRFLQNA
ncbi:MAG: response regulator [Polyangiaceae bacterium]|nr:response regulator [Polyangiaceae bacterium]